jgi:DNA-binding LytR/AlgR family response regulator
MNTTLPLPHLHFKHHLPFPVQDVMRLDGKGNYTVFSLADGTEFLSSRNLGIYETIFPASFFRVHKGCIINLNFLQTLNDDQHMAVLTDGTEVAVSRRRWLEIKTRFVN